MAKVTKPELAEHEAHHLNQTQSMFSQLLRDVSQRLDRGDWRLANQLVNTWLALRMLETDHPALAKAVYTEKLSLAEALKKA
jgi:hypothetical protein